MCTIFTLWVQCVILKVLESLITVRYIFRPMYYLFWVLVYVISLYFCLIQRFLLPYIVVHCTVLKACYIFGNLLSKTSVIITTHAFTKPVKTCGSKIKHTQEIHEMYTKYKTKDIQKKWNEKQLISIGVLKAIAQDR